MSYQFTDEDRRKARKAQAKAEVPQYCEKCGKPMRGKSYNQYLGHLGLHGLADSRHSGDLEAALEELKQWNWNSLDPRNIYG